MRHLHRALRISVVVAAALAGGWLHGQAQAVTACGTTIDVPGDYALANDIGPCTGNGVTITANDVTFDLAGHTITGVSSPASCNTGAPQVGITVSAADNVQISGGTVRGFVDGMDFGASNSRVGDISVSDNCVNGLVVSNAANVTVEGNSITGSGGDGLLLLNADDATVQANTIAANGRFGVLLVSGSDRNTLQDNSLNGNGAPAGGAGLGLLGGTETQIRRNTAQGNLQGIALHTGSNVVEGNLANANQTVGITVAAVAGQNRLDGNTATGNGTFDLSDVNAHCGTNTWQNGVFVTDDVAGVSDGGPGAGCITGITTLACVDVACSSDAKPVLLAQTGAVDVTGPLPQLGRVQGPVTVGEVTLEGRGLYIGAGGDPRVAGGDWTPLLPGPDIALTDPGKGLSISFAGPVFTAGFDFVEPQTGPNVGARFTDATFLLTLEREGVSLRQMAFNAPNDVAAFINVVSDVGFDKMVLRPLLDVVRTATFGVKMLGHVYVSDVPVHPRGYDILVSTRSDVVPDFIWAVHPADAYGVAIITLSDNHGLPADNPTDIKVTASREILVVSPDAGTNDRGALFRIDPVTKQRTQIHDFGNPAQASQGTPFGDNPWGLAVESTGNILVADAGAAGGRGRLFRINAATSMRTILSDFGANGEGTLGRTPVAVAVERSGAIVVVDSTAGTGSRGALFRVDPATRKRELFSDFGDTTGKTGELGKGPSSVAVEASGSLLVVDVDGGTDARGALYRITKDGFRFRLSDFGAGEPLGKHPHQVAVEPGGTIVVVDQLAGESIGGALFRVDPVSGSRSRVSSYKLSPPWGDLAPTGVAILQR